MKLFQSTMRSRCVMRAINLMLSFCLLFFLTIKPLLAAELAKPESAAPERVVIQLKWSHLFQFAGYYAAKEKGFYLAEGLDVALKERDPVKNSINAVLDGDANYGVAGAGLIIKRLRGEPVVLLKQIFQNSPFVLVTRRDSGITNPYQLRNKRVMVDRGIMDTEIRAMLVNTLGEDAPLTLVKPSYRLTELINGDIDALAAYISDQPFTLNKLGVDINILTPSDYAINFYGDNFFTTENEVAKHPDRVAAMSRATIKGWQYALAHPDEIITLIREKYNPELSQEKLVYEAKKIAELIKADEIPLGNILPTRVSSIARIYQQAGFITSGDWGNFLYDHPNSPTPLEVPFHFQLSASEQAWLAQHPVLRVGYDNNHAPFSFIRNGKASGYSIDYIKLLAQRLGVKLAYIHDSFAKLLTKAQHQQVDLLHTIKKTPDRAQYLQFTPAYQEAVNVIVTQNDASPVDTQQDLTGRTIAMITGSASLAKLKKRQPTAQIILVKDAATALKFVASGRVDATITELTVFNHYRSKLTLNTLKIAKELEIPMQNQLDYHLAVPKNLAPLAAILEKAMNSITTEELAALDAHWLEPTTLDTALAPDSTQQWRFVLQPKNLLILAFSAIVLIASILIAFRWLNSSNKNLLFVNLLSRDKLRSLIGLINVILIAVAVIITAWALTNIKNKVKLNSQVSMLAMLESQTETLKLWSQAQKYHLAGLSDRDDIIRLTTQQRQKHLQGHDLKTSPALVKLRAIFDTTHKQQGRLGFVILATDGTNILAMEDSQVGQLNIIKKQRPELLHRAFSGELVLVPPVVSAPPNASSTTSAENELSAVMFFLAPIKDQQGQVIAVLAEQLDPLSIFSKINQLGRIGHSGETYPFNQDGILLSDSRFYQDLAATGLLQAQEKALLTLQLRDPGGDLTSGYKTTTPRHQQPLTRMAKSATNGNSGTDFEGYRDYRGVMVVGAWSWDESLGFGLAVEMDLAEVMASYYSAKTVILVTLFITLILSILSSLLVMLLTNRANRYLRITKAELEKSVEQRTLALQLSEMRLQLVIDNIPGPIFFKDHQGRFQLLNTEFEQVTGFNRDFIIGKTSEQISSPDVGKKIAETDNQALTSGLTVQFEEQVQDMSGNIRDFLTTKVPTFFMGKPGLVGVALDITKRKQAELKLKQVLLDFNEQRFVLDQHAIVSVTDLRGIITHANEKFADTSGYSIDELIGKNHRIFGSGTHKREFWQQMFQTINAGAVWHGEVCNRTKNGKLYWLDTTIAASKGESGRPIAYIAIRSDISARKRYEEQMQQAIATAEAANTAKSEFVASMSHEIRTPMNGILGMLDLLSTSNLSPEQTYHLGIAQNSGQALLTLINDILDFSKVEAGKLEIEALDFNLCTLFKDIAQTMAFRSDEKGLELQLNIERIEHYMVNGDPSRLRQIVLNLVNNAIKFTETGKIEIDVKLTQHDAKYLEFRCRVIDTGIGIPTQAINGLFDSFTQVDASTTRKYGGSGLGLAICKKLCLLMQGDINVTSVQGKGSCFEFTLLLEHAKNTNEAIYDVDSQQLLASTEWPTRTRILLAEDNQVNQVVLKEQLKRLGLNCDVAGNGREVIASLRKSPINAPYSLIFMDCQMPELDGYQASTQIRNGIAGDRYQTVPIVAMTANAMQGDKEKCLNVGMDDYLTKPLKAKNVHLCLIKWLCQTPTEQASKATTKVVTEPIDALTSQVFSLPLLLESCAGDKQMALELAEVFLTYSPINRAELIQAYQHGGNSEIKKLVHKISSSIAYLAVERLCEQAKTIEFLASRDSSVLELKLMTVFFNELNLLHTEAKAWFDAEFKE